LTCRVNCTCKVCGRVRLHVTKRVRLARPKPVDPAAVALQAAMAAMVRRAG
jgi:hypothetical protein